MSEVRTRELFLRDKAGVEITARITRPGMCEGHIVYLENPMFSSHREERHRGHFWLRSLADPDFSREFPGNQLDAASLAALREEAERISPGVLSAWRPCPLAAIAAQQRVELGPLFDLIQSAADANVTEADEISAEFERRLRTA